ncbi:hypothetical protein LINPERPRIM_LOCUS38163, partial [Linum perenne]
DYDPSPNSIIQRTTPHEIKEVPAAAASNSIGAAPPEVMLRRIPFEGDWFVDRHPGFLSIGRLWFGGSRRNCRRNYEVENCSQCLDSSE